MYRPGWMFPISRHNSRWLQADAYPISLASNGIVLLTALQGLQGAATGSKGRFPCHLRQDLTVAALVQSREGVLDVFVDLLGRVCHLREQVLGREGALVFRRPALLQQGEGLLVNVEEGYCPM